MISDLGLGRRHAPDPDDYGYAILTRLALDAMPVLEAPGIDYRYWWNGGGWPNQGNTGTCVGHGWWNWLVDGPVTQKGLTLTPFDIYRGAILRDEWSENDVEASGPDSGLQFGTSIRAGAKFLQELGLIESYLWGYDGQTAIDAVLKVGPLVLGTWWTYPMFEPDAEGIVRYRPTDRKAGGHGYKADGYNAQRDLVRCKQSYSRGWGKRGMFYIPGEDLHRLIVEQGEACLAVEARP